MITGMGESENKKKQQLFTVTHRSHGGGAQGVQRSPTIIGPVCVVYKYMNF